MLVFWCDSAPKLEGSQIQNRGFARRVGFFDSTPDAVLDLCVRYKPEPVLDEVSIFAKSPLEIIRTRKLCPYFWSTLYKAMRPELADASLTTRREDVQAGHIFYSCKPGSKTSVICVDYMLNNRFFFQFRQHLAVWSRIDELGRSLYW